MWAGLAAAVATHLLPVCKLCNSCYCRVRSKRKSYRRCRIRTRQRWGLIWELTVGRDDITQMFADVFDSSTEAAIEEIQIQRVRKISGNVALEEGVVIARDTADGPRHRSRYVALHTKQTDGKWLNVDAVVWTSMLACRVARVCCRPTSARRNSRS